MKKLFLSMILMALPLLVSAYDVEVDGIYYNLKSGNRAEVTYQFYYSGYSPSYYSPYNTTEVTIPEKFTFNGTEYTVTSIGQYAFYECRNLNYVTIPNSVISIGQYAFYKCTGLTSVTIPNSLTIIEPNAFWDCVSLTSVHITDLEAWCKIAFYTYDSNPLIYSHHLYLKGKEIRDLVIPNTISYIQRYSFSGCTGMTSVTIPNSVISIRDGAIFKCTGLTSVTIPNSGRIHINNATTL